MLNFQEIAPDRIRPLKRVEYDRLIGLGVFDGEKIELLRGVLVEMRPIGNSHVYATQRLLERLMALLGERAQVRCRFPLALGDDSEPEPDVAVVEREDYLDDHPTTALLVIEVADSSLRQDRQLKARLYAEAGIADYWIVNLVEECVEVHRAIAGGAYTQVTRVGRGERLARLAFAEAELAVDETCRRGSRGGCQVSVS